MFTANIPTTVDNASPDEEFNEEESRQKPLKNSHGSSKVSFEDYLTLWKGIATSSSSTSPLHALSEHLKTDLKLQKAHFELSRAEVEQEMRIQLAEHRKLMYGTFGGKEEKYADSVGSPRSVPTRIHVLRHVYIGKPSKFSNFTLLTAISLSVAFAHNCKAYMTYLYT